MLTKAFRLILFYSRKYFDLFFPLIDRWLVVIYCTPSPSVRRLLTRPVFEFRRLLVLLRRGLSYKLFVFKGIAADMNVPFSVAYFADGENMDYLISLLFADGQVERVQRGSCSLWALAKTATMLAQEVDLVVVERNSLLKWKPSFGSWVVGPTWIKSVLDFKPGETWEQVQTRFKKQSRYIRRFKEAGYTSVVTNRDEDFDFFYDRMHVPLIETRHKGYGSVGSKKGLYPFFKRGHIRFALNSENQPVAGWLNWVQGDVMVAYVNGVLDADRKWMEDRALSVLYYYLLQWCHENGMRRCDAGGARPFAHDGVYVHKLRWGFHPVQELWQIHQWLFWAPYDSPAALKWLETHPFIPEFAQVGSTSLESVYQKIPSFQSSHN